MGHNHSIETLRRVRAEFLKVLRGCVPAYEVGQLKLLKDDEEEYIRREIERWLFEPDLPNGGEKERKIVERLKRMASTDYWEESEGAANWAEGSTEHGSKGSKKNISWLAMRASEAVPLWVEVLARCNCNGLGCPNCWDKAGRYYFQHPVTAKTDKFRFAWLSELKSVAGVVKDWEAKWFAELLLDGAPEPVSDFQVQALFGVRRWDGSVQRCIRLRNVIGETSKVLVLEAENFGAPEKWRVWCLKQGTFSWRGNQTHLQMVHEDTNRQIAHKIMEDVDACGWHAISVKAESGKRKAEIEMQPGILNGAWFYDECCYYNGVMVKPDEDGVFTLDGQGYYFQERGRESEFALGRPKMQPDKGLLDLPLEIEGWVEASNVSKREKGELTPTGTVGGTIAGGTPAPLPKPAPLEAAVMRGYFREVCHRFYETLGSHEAYIGMGAVYAFAAAPEIFEAHGLFPGLFVHGQMGSGKTKFSEWLAHLQGFRVSAGVSIIKSSTVGILQESQNYSNLLLWLDEFRNDPRAVDEQKIGLLRDAFNRLSPVKWTPDGVQRKIRTAFFVSGESTASDTATRSRYPHVQVSEAKRTKNHLTWFTHQKKNLFVFWRLLMERRAEFVTKVVQHLDEWITEPSLADVDERDKIVHGISWSAWTALAEMLGSHSSVEHAAFMKFAIAHMRAAATDIIGETNVNVFWQLLVTAYEEGAIPIEYFRVESTATEYPPGRRWISYKLFMQIEAVISALQEYLVKRHEAMPLRRRDLMHQSSRNDWWLPTTKKRFGQKGSMACQACWGVDVDKHPLGRQSINELVLAAALSDTQPPVGDIGLIFKDGDPRKGPLFSIIEGVENAEIKQRQMEE